MKKYLGFGKFNAYYKYIFVSAFFALITNILFGYGYCSGLDLLKIPKTDTQLILRNHIIIHNIYRHIGIIIISLIFYLYEIYISKSEIEREKGKSSHIVLIYDDTENELIKKSIFNIILVTIIYIIHDNLTIIYYSSELKDLDFWMLELPILSYFNYKLLKFKIYSHHKLAIYLNAIFSLSFKVFTLILSIISENYLIYNQNKILIPIGILSYLIIILLRGYTVSEIKIFMDLKYISPSKLLCFYGIVGILINIIICILSTYIKCKTIGNYNIHICNIYKEDNSDGIYLENFYIYFKILSTSINYERIIEVIISFIGAITYFFYLYFFILVIKYLTPVHIIFTSLVYGFLTRILIIIYNSINSNSNPNNNNQNYTIIIFKYIFDFLSNTFHGLEYLFIWNL